MHADPTVAAKGVSDGTVVVAANRSINLFPMPARYFCSGHTFFIQQSARPEQCLNVHVTFTEGGVHGKLWRLQEAGLWHLHPRGYFDSGRYLTIRPPRIPTPYPPARLEPLAPTTRSAVLGLLGATSQHSHLSREVSHGRGTNGNLESSQSRDFTGISTIVSWYFDHCLL